MLRSLGASTLAATLAVASSLPTRAPTCRVEVAITNAGFEVTQFGVSKQHGRFERVWGTIVLDAAGGVGSLTPITHGGGEMRIIAFITDASTIRDILVHR